MLKGTPVYGIGINDADYPVNITEGEGKQRKIIWRCAYYQKWVNMLDRVNGSHYRPSYVETSVCEDWLNFSAFKSWMEQQDWQGKELDKDLKGDGTLYSPETCVFVSKKVNMLVQLRKPMFYRGYWKATVRLPDGTRARLHKKDRASVLADYVAYKKRAVDMLPNECCSDYIRSLIYKKLETFYEENL